MEIVVVRHGETEWSAIGKHTGTTDLPLTESGRRKAALLRPVLAQRSFSLVLCSPLRRARETCELAGLSGLATECDDLREWNYGEYEGMTTPEIRHENPSWNLWRDGAPGGESPEAVGLRANRALERLRGADGDGDVIAFAHGHILRVLTARWLGMDVAEGARFAFAAGAIGVLGFERETEVLTRWNLIPE